MTGVQTCALPIFHPGVNVGIGSDDTLFAKADGVLRFEKLGKDRKQACVYPAE